MRRHTTIQLAARLQRNFSRFLDHALRPSDVWRVRRQASSVPYPEVRRVAERFSDLIISRIALNHLGIRR